MKLLQTKLINNSICNDRVEFDQMLAQQIQLAHHDLQKLLIINVELLLPVSVPKIDEKALVNFLIHFDSLINKNDDDKYIRLICLKGEESSNLTILLNRTDYPDINNHSAHMGKMSLSIKQSWANALGCELSELFEKVRYPINPIYVLEKDITLAI